MAIKRWKEEYSVGIELFDNQHKKMFGFLNDLNNALAEDEEKKVLAAILLGLIAYAKDHFKDEEINLKKYNYPEYDEHKKEHEDLTKEVLKFVEEFKSGNLDITMDVIYFLISWIVDHIEGSDKKYTQFLKGKKITGKADIQKANAEQPKGKAEQPSTNTSQPSVKTAQPQIKPDQLTGKEDQIKV
ncbi:MAG: hemerythrin family protein [Calditrichaeota bacterium]|jgi:hemerythrin|nr:hemerythrin family protein [Calditrichota bacterium]MBT7616131.1 hemerythrin family protein [Calditrichota bacterium]MBT7789083.1 hemerythrin family protein [Calditrichota bacterium]